tara:strand:+ start:356 stop:913 length:558 start_codon:yes stop_codon:yes gene_type:complete
MKKLNRNNWEDVGLFLLAITFNPITVVILVLIGIVGCTSPSGEYAKARERCEDKCTSINSLRSNDNIIWRVSYIDTDAKIEDYIHSTSKNGCKCSYQPYEFRQEYFEMVNLADDSVAVVDRFRKSYPKTSNVVYEVYPYCKVKDWATVETFDDNDLLTIRNTLIDTWIMCQRFGLIDTKGHYINY